ncbi:MAG: dihydrodipicolinate synthase family protein [Mangrovibacterium sp.]
MKNTRYKGVVVPMISPLTADFKADTEATKRIVKYFGEYGVHPFIAGTTGEVSGLSLKQKGDLVKAAVEAAHADQVVYASVASNCFEETVDMCKSFADMNAEVAVATLPSYYPITEAQAAKYMEKLADVSPIPVIFYNITATTNWSIPLDLLEKLSYHPNIAGLKDSERDEARLDRAIELWKDREDFVHLIGWAAQSASGLLKGSDGIVPSSGNFAPKIYADLYAAALAGNAAKAHELQEITNKLGIIYQQGRTLAESLAALKVIMSEQQLCGTQVTPPIYEMEASEEAAYRKFVGDELAKLNWK